MKNVLITGGGFIGSHLFQTILDERPDIEKLVYIYGSKQKYYWENSENGKTKIYQLSMDLNKNDLLTQLPGFKFDTVFHTAGIAKVSADPHALFPANIETTFNLLETLTDCRFIFTSSSTVYGNGYKEIHFDEHDKLLPTSFYGTSKVASESIVDAYTRMGRINGINLRLCANVGPNATHGLLKDLIYKAKQEGSELELFGNRPGSIKPFIHVDDTVRAMLWFAEEKKEATGAYNVSTYDTLTVSEVADLVLKEVGAEKTKKWLGQDSIWVGDNTEFSMSNKKLLRTGFELKYKNSKEAVIQAIKENL